MQFLVLSPWRIRKHHSPSQYIDVFSKQEAQLSFSVEFLLGFCYLVLISQIIGHVTELNLQPSSPPLRLGNIMWLKPQTSNYMVGLSSVASPILKLSRDSL